jgi:hypothetical protein
MKFKMRARCESRLSATCALTACCIAIAGATMATAQQSAVPAPAAPVSLQSYTAPDNSASAGVPAGWKVTKGAYGVIQMSGPQGEAISLGNGLFVMNGPFKLGQMANGPISMTMPYQAPLAQKYAMLWQQASAQAGDPTALVSIVSATPIALGNVAQCGIFLGKLTNAKGAFNFESRFCALPMDTNGVFKLFWLNAQIPAALAAQERATAEAVLQSYKPSPDSLKMLLKPATPPMAPPSAPRIAGGGGGGGGGESSTQYAERTEDETSTCMDLGVIREEPERRLPSYCR